MTRACASLAERACRTCRVYRNDHRCVFRHDTHARYVDHQI